MIYIIPLQKKDLIFINTFTEVKHEVYVFNHRIYSIFVEFKGNRRNKIEAFSI